MYLKLKQGDCLELMKEIEDEFIDLILCDLPYGSTQNHWDSVIDLEKLWKEYSRIIKRNGCIALFAQAPFDKVLGTSNLKMFRYEWIIEKTKGTGHLIRSDQIRTIADDKESRDRVERMKHNMEEWERKHP